MADAIAYRAMGAEYARKSRAEQGLPPGVEDPETIAKLRVLLTLAVQERESA